MGWPTGLFQLVNRLSPRYCRCLAYMLVRLAVAKSGYDYCDQLRDTAVLPVIARGDVLNWLSSLNRR